MSVIVDEVDTTIANLVLAGNALHMSPILHGAVSPNCSRLVIVTSTFTHSFHVPDSLFLL